MSDYENLIGAIRGCRLCAAEFSETATAHVPRPVAWFSRKSRILVAGQAPGLRVHKSGKPFTDPSGDRLRGWLGLDEDNFYDRTRVAIVPMAFCFPGYDDSGADLPPPKICASTWHNRVIEMMPHLKLTVLVGGHAQKWHLGSTCGVTENVKNWRSHAPGAFCLPHPSWRNNAWLKKNDWFEHELLPELKVAIAREMAD